jgi:hypothetical protein
MQYRRLCHCTYIFPTTGIGGARERVLEPFDLKRLGATISNREIVQHKLKGTRIMTILWGNIYILIIRIRKFPRNLTQAPLRLNDTSSPEEIFLLQPDSDLLTLKIKGNEDQVDHNINSGNCHEDTQNTIGSDIVVDHPRPDPRDATLESSNGDHDLDGKL